LTSDKVLKAVAEVQEGRIFCLSMPLDYPGGTAVNPRRNPPKLTPTERNGMPNMVYPLGRDDPRLVDVICDDQVLLTLQYSIRRSGTASRMSASCSTLMATARRRSSFIMATVPANTSPDLSNTAMERLSSVPAAISARPRCRSTIWRRKACRAAAS